MKRSKKGIDQSFEFYLKSELAVAEKAGSDLAQSLLDRGAGRILEAAKAGK